MGKQIKIAKNNGNLSLYPLKFEQEVKGLLKVKLEVKEKDTTKIVVMIKEGEE